MSRSSEPKPRQRFHDADVEKLKAALTTGQQNFEPKSRAMGMRDLMAALREDIVALRQRGYTVDVIATMIHEGGFNYIAPSTLRRYLSETSARKRRHRKHGAKPQPVRASTPGPLDSSNPAQSSATSAQDAGFAVIPDREDL